MHTDRRAADVFLNVGHALDHLFMLIYPTVVLAMAPAFGRTYGEMLPLSLGGWIMFGAASLPAGWLADRWSRHGMMTVFFVGIGAASILTGFARTPVEVAAGITLMGVFAAIYHPVGIAMLVAGREKVGKALGINGVFGNLGLAFAALIAGALAQWIDWRAAFIVPGLVSMAVGAGFALLVPGDPPRAAGAKRPAGAGHGRDVMVRVFTILIISTICGGVIFNSTTVAMPKIFDERLSALVDTTFGIGVLVCIVYSIAAMAQLVVGHLIDRMPLRNVLLGVVALQLPLLWLAGSSQDAAMLVVAVAMMFFVFGQVPINDAMVAAYTDEHWRARVFALRYVVSFLGSATAVPLVAYVHRTSGDFQHLFWVLAALAATMLAAGLAFPAGRPRAATARA